MRRWWIFGGCLAWLLISLFPLYFGIVTSFKTLRAISPDPTYIPWVDFAPSLQAWDALFFGDFTNIWKPFLNSALIGVAATALAVLTGAMAAYALVRFQYRVKLLSGLAFAVVGIGGYVALRQVGASIALAMGLAFVCALALSLAFNALNRRAHVHGLAGVAVFAFALLIFLPMADAGPDQALGAPSLFGVSTQALLIVLVCLAGGYAAGWWTAYRLWPGKVLGNNDVVFWFISQRMFPPIVSAFALYLLYKEIGDAGLKMIDTYWGMVLVYVAFSIPIVVWLMRDFFAALPVEIEEAALVDNVPRWRIFFGVVLPMSMPGLIATSLITLGFIWNEFLFALILTTSNWQTLPIQVSAANSVRGTEWWAIAAVALVAIAPMIVITIILSRMMRSGVMLGSIK